MADSGSPPIHPDPTRLLFAGILNGVIHDLNGISANLLGLIEMAADHQSFPGTDPMKLLRLEAIRITDLAADLAALSMSVTRPPEAVSLSELLDQAIRLLDHDPNYSDTRKRCTCPAELPAVYARRQGLLESFLLTGALACSAVGHKGEVTFTCEKQGEDIRVQVLHTGGAPLAWNALTWERVTTLVELEEGEARLGDYASEFTLPIPA